MSVSIQNVSSSSSKSSIKDPYGVIAEKVFFQKFCWGKAIMIGTDEADFVDSATKFDSISSFDIGDCITIFAVEKEQNKNKTVLGWHIGADISIKKLIDELKGYDYSNPYDIYIIGGNSSTTTGKNCLLDKIRQAIKKTFNAESQVVLELLNLDEKTKKNFVSANLQLSGTLTLCYHNNRHL